jgi:hypothetical protein
MVEKVAVGQILPYRVLQFSPDIIIPPLLRAHLHLTKTNMRSLGTFQKAILFRKSWSIGQRSTSFFLRMKALFIRHQ